MVKTFRQTIVLLGGIFLWQQTNAQSVSNVSVTQQGQELAISYSLVAESPCEVSLYVSLDSGRSWQGPLTNCTGDVGKGVTAGARHIRWNVLGDREQLVGNAVQFKIVANGRNPLEPEMVFVEGGRFMMGNSTSYVDGKPIHEVELNSYHIGKYEVTQAQWKAVMGKNPSYFKDCDKCPVESVSWNDAQEFIKKLNQKTDKKYRLPTEAEWEYAARGGAKSKGYTYSGSNEIDPVGWLWDNSSYKTHEAGGKKANELGIFDMSGNVWEWCSDWNSGYSGAFQRNPQGASSGQYRVLRGGSWGSYHASDCQVSHRNGNSPDDGNLCNGFRLVLSRVQ